jgi:thioredoxin 1
MNLVSKGNEKQEIMPMKPLEITSPAAFGQAINAEYRIVYCNTSWSAPCRAQYLILRNIADNYTGWDPIAQVDLEKNPGIAAELAIQSIPTILVFSRGKELQRIVGLQTLENLLEALADFVPVRAAANFNEETKRPSTEALDSEL